MPRESSLPRSAPSPDPWSDDLLARHNFVKRLPDYEQLCIEVAYTLRKRLTERRIAFAGITWRTKTLDSFLEKLRRKTLRPEQVTDRAGVRVVSLFKDDLTEIEQIIRAEFDVKEKVDKLDEKGVDQIGYGAIHFIVQLGANVRGARYDDLGGLRCEIQTRTVLQDAWAIIEEKLGYKKVDVPDDLARGLNLLAGSLERDDKEFQAIARALKKRREKYRASVRKISSRDKGAFLETPINADSVVEYLRWKFPDQPLELYDTQVAQITCDLDKTVFAKLNDLDASVDRTQELRAKVRARDGRRWVEGNAGVEGNAVPASAELVWAVALDDEGFRANANMNPRTREIIEETLRAQ
jgi:ppGpp synthetase/RelA/SpoT-type nucleotidyltranferase